MKRDGRISLAHVVNPVAADKASDLAAAQPITFETMRIAREFAEKTDGVRLYAVQSQGETRVPLPECFVRVSDLTRSVTDVGTFSRKKNLPLIGDILGALVRADLAADYLVYTNVDIAVQPHFYRTVASIIQQGYDAFVVNRRTISGRYSNVEQLPFMYAEVGEAHPGYDCFVFRRDIYPKFKLGTMCIGTAWIGRALLANMVAYSGRFKEFRNEHLTFHIGDAVPWRNAEYSDYLEANRNEYLRIFRQVEEEKGGFQPVWRSYLLETGSRRQFPVFE